MSWPVKKSVCQYQYINTKNRQKVTRLPGLFFGVMVGRCPKPPAGAGFLHREQCGG